jgi:hypothetical protein
MEVLVSKDNGDRLQVWVTRRVRFSFRKKYVLPSKDFGMAFYRRVGMEEAKASC